MNSLRALALVALIPMAVHAQEARKSFDKLKALAGNWEGTVTTDPKAPEIDGKTMQVSLRVTSMGHTLMHEMTSPSRPDDPITMFYLENDKLMLQHFCDADNRPRMSGAMTADQKKVEFDFMDVSGNLKYGHMHRAAFTFIDENHHIEDWTFMIAPDKHVVAHVDLKRKP